MIQEVIRDEGGLAIDMRYMEINPAFTRQTGLGPEIVGKLVSEVLPDVERFFIDIHDRVARTGMPERFENYNQSTKRWYDAHITAVGGQGRLAASVFEDVSARKLAEIALRESEERQAFLLKLSDTLRPLGSPADVQEAASRSLAEYLGVNRAMYSEFEGEGENRLAFIRGQYVREGASFPSPVPYSAFIEGPAGDILRAGETLVVEDAASETRFGTTARDAWLPAGIVSIVAVALVKNGQEVAHFGIHNDTPRRWRPTDVALVWDVAERTWAAGERARAEAGLRESEERFQQFAAASAAGLWIRRADTLVMEFVSPAVGTIYGVALDALLGDVTRWAAMIVPEDRDVALGHLNEAREGQVAVHEFRIQRPSDGTFRWIRNTDFPLHDDGHIPRIGGIVEDVTEAKLAAEHSTILLAELQHRVRNIMAVIRAITARTGEGAASVAEYADLMAGRLLTLARVQALLTRAANAGVGILEIVRDELDALAHHEGQHTIEGPDLVLAPKAAEVLTLAIHELTTNALKYGALSVPDGHVTVRWATFERRGAPWLGFDWTEARAPERPPPEPAVPRRRGFGSELIEGRIPYELGGRGKVVIEPGGARCRLEFPLRDGDSILETDAPQRARVFGGSIDMTGEADLTGRRVLVIEDDYYLATDTTRALQGAGAEVLGPCPNEDAARDELDEQRPDAAVVDINLGFGPSFKLAEALRDQGIPFVFTTGYDPEVIPAEFAAVERLQKPVQLRQIVGAVSKLLSAVA